MVNRRRGWLAGLTGLGAIAVALVMVLSPAAAATSGAVTLHAKWKGAVSPQNDGSFYGCATAKVTKAWNFKLKSGDGGGASTGKAGDCKKSASSLGLSSDAYVDGGVSVAIPLKAHSITSKTTSVAMNSILSENVAIKESDGVASNTAPAPACTAAPSTYHYYDFDYEWNYTYNSLYGYSYFNDYNYSYGDWDNYSGGSYYYQYAYGSGPTPSPFPLNNTTYEDLYDYWGADSYCQASASFYIDQDANLIDTTTGAYMTETNATYANYLSVDIESYSQIDWDCGYDFYWYGPSNYTFGNTTATCYSYNTTLTSYVDSYSYSYIPPYTYSSSYVTGTNNTQVWSSIGATHESAYWNDTFSGTDQYELEFDLYVSMSASDSWAKGFGMWDLNAATGGNGYKLVNLVIS